MKTFLKIKIALLIGFVTLSSFTVLHKYYVSVTEVSYAKKEQTLQIISRLFIDDFQASLQKRYGTKIVLEDETLKAINDEFITKYFSKKFIIKVNGKQQKLNLIGSKFEEDRMILYFEIEKVISIQSFSITNQLLFDSEYEQQNVTHVDINETKKSFLLIKDKDTQLLKF